MNYIQYYLFPNVQLQVVAVVVVTKKVHDLPNWFGLKMTGGGGGGRGLEPPSGGEFFVSG